VGTTLTGAVPTPWRYQGRLLESTPGGRDLYDLTARSYAPDLGAFTSLDSVAGSAQNPVSLDRYLYAAANPETLVDPTGHCANSWWCQVSEAVPFLSAVAWLAPDDAPQQVADAINPYSPSMAATIGFADRGGQIATDSVKGVANLAVQSVRYQADPTFRQQVAASIVASGRGFAADPGAAVRSGVSSAALRSAKWSGSMQDALTSGNGYRFGAAAADVTSVASVALDAGIGVASLARAGLAAFRGLRGARDLEAAIADGIHTPQGIAFQDYDPESLALRDAVRAGAPVYRQGQFGRTNAAAGQFWSGVNPASAADYAAVHGLPDSGAPDWIMGGRVSRRSQWITRRSPAIYPNAGGAPEVVTAPGGVEHLWFHMPGSD
jgi:RHS repeat-associated protein